MTGPEMELSFTVDLDQEKGIAPRPGRSNLHRVTIRRTKKLDLGLIDAYLQGKMSFDNSVLEGISKRATHNSVIQLTRARFPRPSPAAMAQQPVHKYQAFLLHAWRASSHPRKWN